MTSYGKTARVRYRGTLADGTVFDSTEGKEPLEFVVGSGEVIHGFDEAVASMEVGESRHVVMPACDAFGERIEEKVELAPMYAIPNAKDIEVGRLFYFVTEEGLRFPAKVLEVREGMARVDFNHPLAGKELAFDIELVGERECGAARSAPRLREGLDVGQAIQVDELERYKQQESCVGIIQVESQQPAGFLQAVDEAVALQGEALACLA